MLAVSMSSLSLLNASSPKGASAHVMHAVLFLWCSVLLLLVRLWLSYACSLACVPRVHVPACVAAAGVGPFLFFSVCSSFGSDT